MRRLVRRAIRYAFDLGLQQNFFPEIVPTGAGMYSGDYPEVAERGEQVIAVLVKEEKVLRQTLRKGIKQLGAYAGNGISGTELFTLLDTYGFPVELSTEEPPAAGHRGEVRIGGPNSTRRWPSSGGARSGPAR
jgi:alanyl-tRNA synthetase